MQAVCALSDNFEEVLHLRPPVSQEKRDYPLLSSRSVYDEKGRRSYNCCSSSQLLLLRAGCPRSATASLLVNDDNDGEDPLSLPLLLVLPPSGKRSGASTITSRNASIASRSTRVRLQLY